MGEQYQVVAEIARAAWKLNVSYYELVERLERTRQKYGVDAADFELALISACIDEYNESLKK